MNVRRKEFPDKREKIESKKVFDGPEIKCIVRVIFNPREPQGRKFGGEGGVGDPSMMDYFRN
jgi:hypothetical protein